MKNLRVPFLLAVLSLPLGCASNNGNNGGGSPPTGPASPGYFFNFNGFLGTYGATGTGNNQFNGPEQVAITGDSLFVVDEGNTRLEKFDLAGNYEKQVAIPSASYPWGLVVDVNSVLYVGDEGNGNIWTFDTSLHPLGAYTPSIAPDRPDNFAADSVGNIYFTNRSNNVLERCSNSGASCVTVGGAGSGVGQFSEPVGVAVDPSGNVYVVDYGNNRVQKFNSALASPSVFVGPGTASGFVTLPLGVGTDPTGNILVSDTPISGNSRVQMFSPSGSYLTSLNTPVGQPFSGSFDLVGIAVDHNENVFVSDWENRVVYKFKP